MGHTLEKTTSKKDCIAFVQRQSTQGERLVFGMSVSRLDDAVSMQTLRRHQAAARALCMDIKRHLQSLDIAVRVVTGKTRMLSSAQTVKSKMLSRGAEMMMLVTKNDWRYGVVDAVQDINAFTARDVHRPARDTHAGMLPPKLARIMTNIAFAPQSRAHPVLLDPFCGSGTVLQEAMLLGCDVIGADKSPSAIKGTTQNIAWLLQSIQKRQDTSHTIFRSDIRKITDHLRPQSVDAIVTEPFLGDPARRPHTVAALRPMIQKLSALYHDAFRIFKTVLRPGGRVVIVFPRFVMAQSRREAMSLSTTVLPELREWKHVHAFPQEYRKQFADGLTSDGAFLYARPDQYIQREIFVFEHLRP